MGSKSAEKKAERISKQQKQLLVNYMSSNLEFARGQFAGINGNCSYKEEWKSLRISLNSLGGSEKTVEQWKKCWIDLKSGVRKTVNARRRFMNQTGGDSWANAPRDLNPLEEQILKIMTIDAVEGDAFTPEFDVKLENESLEEFESIDYMDEVCTQPMKKPRKELNVFSDFNSSTSKAFQTRKLPFSSTSKSTSKYADVLDEARAMQKAVVEQLNRIESQNIEILQKLNKIINSNFPLT